MPTLTWEEIDALRDGAEREYQRSEIDVALIGRIDALEQVVGRMTSAAFAPSDQPTVAQMQAQIDQLVENTTRLKQMVIDLTQQRAPEPIPPYSGPFGCGYVTTKILAARKKTRQRRRAIDSAARRPTMKKKPKKPGKKC